MDEARITIEGMGELVDSLERLARKYPDMAGDLLRKEASEIRKEVIQRVKDTTRTGKSKKWPLEKTGSYRVSQPKGIGTAQYVEISARAPHFHLVEHGHVLKPRGRQASGFVQGKHMMQETVKRHEEEMPSIALAMVEKLLKKEGFT